MARPHIPTHIQELKGAFKKDPKRGRAREGEPIVKAALGDPPPHLNAKQKAIWHEVAAMIPAGVATFADRLALELISRLILKVREDRNTNGDLSALIALMGKMGLTSSDRAKLSVPKQADEQDEFAKFLN